MGRGLVDKRLMENNDAFRRQRKQVVGAPEKEVEAELIPAEEKTLSKILLAIVPVKPAWEVFEDGNDLHTLLRQNTAKGMRVPTSPQLQAFAKADGKTIKFSEVAPLLVDFTKRILDTFLEHEIMVVDNYALTTEGSLSAWTAANNKWMLDVWPEERLRFAFKSDKQPIIEIS